MLGRLDQSFLMQPVFSMLSGEKYAHNLTRRSYLDLGNHSLHFSGLSTLSKSNRSRNDLFESLSDLLAAEMPTNPVVFEM